MEIDKKLEWLRGRIETMYAIELLEYHDKNHLSGDNKSRSEIRQEELKYCMRLVDDLKEYFDSNSAQKKFPHCVVPCTPDDCVCLPRV